MIGRSATALALDGIRVSGLDQVVRNDGVPVRFVWSRREHSAPWTSVPAARAAGGPGVAGAYPASARGGPCDAEFAAARQQAEALPESARRTRAIAVLGELEDLLASPGSEPVLGVQILDDPDDRVVDVTVFGSGRRLGVFLGDEPGIGGWHVVEHNDRGGGLHSGDLRRGMARAVRCFR